MKIESKALCYLAILVILFSIPLWVTHQYYLHILIIMLLYSIVALGLRLIWRIGQVSLAQAGFMAIGAYATSLMVKILGFSFWLALPLGGVTAAVIAIAIGIPTLKLRGSYFFLVTFAIGEVVRLFFSYIWVPVLGGPNGLDKIPPPDAIVIPGLVTLEFGSKVSYYYLVLVVFLIIICIMQRIDISRIGTNILACRESEDLAEAIGIPTMRYRIFTFAAGSFCAGIAGGIYASYHTQISPVSFTMIQSTEFLANVVVGGGANVLGPVLGTVLLKSIGEAVRGYGEYEVIFSGFLMIVVMIFMPGGILSIPKYIRSFVRKRRGIIIEEEARRGSTT